MSKITSMLAILIPCCVLFGAANAQQLSFRNKYDIVYNDEPSRIIQTSDGGYVVVGSFSTAFFQIYPFAIRVNGRGDLDWLSGRRIWRGQWYAASVVQTGDSGYAFVGGGAYGVNRSILVRLLPTGDTLWTKLFSNGTAASFARAPDGNFVIVGCIPFFPADSARIFVHKTTSIGTTIWRKEFSVGFAAYAHDVQMLADGGSIIAGTSLPIDSDSAEILLLRIDSNGDSLWARKFSGSNRYSKVSLADAPDNGFVVLSDTVTNSMLLLRQLYLVRVDSLGRKLWTKSYEGGATSFAGSVSRTVENGFVVLGTVGNPDSNRSFAWLLRTDSNGDTLWTRNFILDTVTVGTSVIQTSDRGYAFTGWSRGPSSVDLDDSVFVVKTTPTGFVGIEQEEFSVRSFLLHQNYPNPFNPTTTIKYQLATQSKVTIKIFNLLGQVVKKLVDGIEDAGQHQLQWDGKNNFGSGVATGVYFYRIETNAVGSAISSFTQVKKMLLLR